MLPPTGERGAKSANARASRLVTVVAMSPASAANRPRSASDLQRIAIELVDATSAVLATVDERHVARLAEMLERCPPITVGADGVLVDGAHRLEAARLRGWETIAAIVVPQSSRAEVLLAAVRANSRHGLPLTRAERWAVVAELLLLEKELSDRAIAEACGVARSVAAARSQG